MRRATKPIPPPTDEPVTDQKRERSPDARHARTRRSLQPAQLRQRAPSLRRSRDPAGLVLHLEEILRARTRPDLLQVLELHRPPEPRARNRQLHHLQLLLRTADPEAPQSPLNPRLHQLIPASRLAVP